MGEILEKIIITKDFTDAPGARSPKDGEYSGEEFLEKLLKPKFEKVMHIEGGLLHVDLDSTEGYATSFLEAAFGGLARIYGINTVLDHLDFKSLDEPGLVDEIKQYIFEAND